MTITKSALRCKSGALHILEAKNGQWYFVAKAGNGEIMATSETYTRKHDAARGARRFATLLYHSSVIFD